MIPWLYKLVEGGSWASVEVKLKKGEAPPERINVKTKGYILRQVGIQNQVGVATYELIMEVV